VAEICQADVTGDELDSTEMEFSPNSPPLCGSYTFDVAKFSAGGHSAGSVTLILQALLWPLLFADDETKITCQGGTFVPFSPPYHYLAEVAQPACEQLGADFETKLNAWGWMTAGEGEITVHIKPVEILTAYTFEPVNIKRVNGVAAVTNLPSHIPHRMARRAYNLLTQSGLDCDVQPIRERGAGPGAGIILWTDQAGFTALGRKGLPADKVAEKAVADLMAFKENGAAVDRYLADQLLVPMALAQGISTLTTDHLTLHTLTNVSLLRQWINVNINVDGQPQQPAHITVHGMEFNRD
jgi:RNA 3'-terminal phosphate cyclase (ATP)